MLRLVEAEGGDAREGLASVFEDLRSEVEVVGQVFVLALAAAELGCAGSGVTEDPAAADMLPLGMPPAGPGAAAAPGVRLSVASGRLRFRWPAKQPAGLAVAGAGLLSEGLALEMPSSDVETSAELGTLLLELAGTDAGVGEVCEAVPAAAVEVAAVEVTPPGLLSLALSAPGEEAGAGAVGMAAGEGWRWVRLLLTGSGLGGVRAGLVGAGPAGS